MAHKIFDSDKLFGKLLLYAMHHYGRYDSMIKEDKSGKLIIKIQAVAPEKPDAKDLALIMKVFPDLKNFHP